MSSTENKPAHILLGRIIGVHGVRGWVKLYSECRPRESIFQYPRFFAKRGQHFLESPLKLIEGKIQGKGLIARFEHIDNRDKAYELMGINLYIERGDLPEPDDGEFYWSDLIGMSVINQKDQYLGIVKELFETGANDVVVVQDAQKREHLLPFIVPDVIRLVDFDHNTLEVHWDLDWLEGQD